MLRIVFFIGIFVLCLQSNAQLTLEYKNVDSLINWIETKYYNPVYELRNSNYKDVIVKKYLDLKTSNVEIVAIDHKNELTYETREIFNLDSTSLNLIVPLAFPTEISEGEYKFDCEKNQSILNFSSNSSNKSLKINLNPYCSQSYCIDEVDITLFKTKFLTYPVVVIISNHPAYVPAEIFVYSKEENGYTYLKTLHLF